MTVHVVHIDSRDREPGSSSSKYRVRLPTKFKHVVSARLRSAEIPSSFYVFRQDYGNTSLKFVVYPPNGPQIAKMITIPDGNYTATQLAVALRVALDAAFSPLTFEVEVSTTTLKMSFANTDGYDMGIDTTGVTTEGTEWGLGYYVGLHPNEILAGPTITAPRVASTNPYTYLVLDIEELNGAYEGAMNGSSMAPHGCFAKIPFGVNSFEYVFLDASQSPMEYIQYKPPLPSVDSLRVRFRFHDNRLVDFEDLEHSFTLEITTKDPTQLTGQTHPVNYQAARAVEAATAASTAASSAAKAVKSMAAAQVSAQKYESEQQRRHAAIRRRWIVGGILVAIAIVVIARASFRGKK